MNKFVCAPLALVGALLSASVASAQPMSLVIGIDGLGFGEQGFSVASTPVMDSLINGTWQSGYNGAYSDSAFAGGVLGTPTQQVTSSGPGWSTILTGVWVDQHDVPNNSFSSPDYENNPSYLETLEENVAGLHSASIVNWTPIDTFIIASVDDGNSSMDHRDTPGNDANVTAATVSHIATIGSGTPAAIFVHLDEVDGAGHSVGSAAPGFAAEINEKDGQVGQMLDAIVARPNFANEDWQIIITADHGEEACPPCGHGGQGALSRTTPFIVASMNLAQGNLPLDFPQEVSHADVAPTVLDHFGLDVSIVAPQYYGVSRAGGAIFANPDINRNGIIFGDGTGEFGNDDVVAFVSLWLKPNTLENPNPADLNLDGIADIADWAILNAENPSMGGAILAALGGDNVPEPGTATLAILLGMLFVFARRP